MIDEIGPDGHFLDCDHTMRHFRDDWYPSLMDRRNYEDWVVAGRKTVNDRARERVDEILKSESHWVLSQGVQKKLRTIREKAEPSIR